MCLRLTARPEAPHPHGQANAGGSSEATVPEATPALKRASRMAGDTKESVATQRSICCEKSGSLEGISLRRMFTVRQSTPASKLPPLRAFAALAQYMLWKVLPVHVINGSSSVAVGTDGETSSGHHAKTEPSGARRADGELEVQPMSFKEDLVPATRPATVAQRAAPARSQTSAVTTHVWVIAARKEASADLWITEVE